MHFTFVTGTKRTVSTDRDNENKFGRANFMEAPTTNNNICPMDVDSEVELATIDMKMDVDVEEIYERPSINLFKKMDVDEENTIKQMEVDFTNNPRLSKRKKKPINDENNPRVRKIKRIRKVNVPLNRPIALKHGLYVLSEEEKLKCPCAI